MNRPELMALVGQRVTITSRHNSSTWTGKLVAVTDQPTMVLDQADGTRMVLPQSYTVTPADDTPPTAVDPGEPGPVYTWPNVPPTADHVVGVRVHDWPDMQAVAQDLATLGDMLANLQQHIDERAAELAQPLIDQARAEVVEAQEERDSWRTRFTDLQRECQRQYQAVERRAVRAETGIACVMATVRLNTRTEPATDYARGYQACADHVARALHGTSSQAEGTPA